jgi:hypothetical protein
VPIAAAYAADAVLEIGFLPKYAIVAAPAVTLAAMEGLARLPSRWSRLATASLVAGCAAMTSWLRTESRFEDFRGASRELLEAWREGDRVVVLTATPEPFASGVVRHYLRERPDVLASLLPEDGLPDLLAESAPGERLHVVFRESSGATEKLQAIERVLVPVARGPRRIAVEHSLWRAP